jgi:hypothetical protein
MIDAGSWRAAVIRWVFIAVLVVSIVLPAGAAETSKTYSFATYKESSGLVTLLVSSKLALWLEDSPYVPLLVGVGVREKGPTLLVSPASFALIDQQGAVHTMAPFVDVRDAGVIPFYRELVRRDPLTTGRTFSNSHLVSSIFYPVSGASAGKELVELTQRTHFIDLIFFPRPETDLGGVITLQFMARGLKEPIQVRFEIPGQKKKKKTADK